MVESHDLGDSDANLLVIKLVPRQVVLCLLLAVVAVTLLEERRHSWAGEPPGWVGILEPLAVCVQTQARH
jgi:hypothetical protein